MPTYLLATEPYGQTPNPDEIIVALDPVDAAFIANVLRGHDSLAGARIAKVLEDAFDDAAK